MNQKAKQREATRQALLAALGTELLTAPRLTVEGIAAAAQVNKALVYRYFGGLPGLIAYYAESDGFMPRAEELLSFCRSDLRRLSPRARFAQCLTAYIQSLARRPVSVQILLRLPSFDRATLAALKKGRIRSIEEIRRVFGPSDPTLGFDLDLAFNLMVAGACQLLGAHRSSWIGKRMPLPELTERLVKMVEGLVWPGGKVKAKRPQAQQEG